MAEVESRSSGKGRKRKAARVDMTAMVDVAFLLLTFFVLTTTLAKPPAIELATPVDDGSPTPIDQEKILTLILGKNNQVLYYYGIPEGNLKRTDFSESGLRKLIFDHLKKREGLCSEEKTPDCWDPIFVLKPSKDCIYKNVVDAVDELRLADAPKYIYADVTPVDSLLLLDHRY